MLHIPDHQVAGHKAEEGKRLGPVVDDSGRFYKPLQSEGRGSSELTFYTSFASATDIPNRIRTFFPTFYGTQTLEASDGTGPLDHLILEDLVFGLSNPSIMDIKIGARTWYPEASEDYIEKCFKRDRETTSVTLGFHISGLQVNRTGLEVWKPDRHLVHEFKSEDVFLALKKFVSSDPETNLDCEFAKLVYGGSGGILAQLIELKEWFETQTIFHFNSCSVLVLFDKESGRVQVKLIDFAHVIEGGGVIDHNFLGGLCSLIKFVSNVVIEAEN